MVFIKLRLCTCSESQPIKDLAALLIGLETHLGCAEAIVFKQSIQMVTILDIVPTL
jgi:hypothetical protein